MELRDAGGGVLQGVLCQARWSQLILLELNFGYKLRLYPLQKSAALGPTRVQRRSVQLSTRCSDKRVENQMRPLNGFPSSY